MVVDLVRNDLSKICLEGTVKVDELYGIYTFPQVHQMISTVSGELPPDRSLADCIRATFPMGSMTGAPKNRVVGLIEEVEKGSRGLFSGGSGLYDAGRRFRSQRGHPKYLLQSYEQLSFLPGGLGHHLLQRSRTGIRGMSMEG